VPGPQSRQKADPEADAVPEGQTVQTLLPVLFCWNPASQLVHAVTLPPPTENLPEAHSVHVEELTRENVPRAQIVQTVEAEVENDPPGHAEQFMDALK